MFVYIFLLTLFAAETAYGQVGRRYYDKDGNYIPPSEADVDYKTFVYGQRRYGQNPSNYPPSPGSGGRPYNPYGPQIPSNSYGPEFGADGRYNPPNIYSQNYNPLEFQPGIPRQNDPRFDQAGIELPGILGGWRADLQGKQRPDSPKQETDRDVVVTTSYGQVQGFRVYLYDRPDPGFRPWYLDGKIERAQTKVVSFLGIPYAVPPVNEGRFKPPRPHPGWQQVLHAVDFGPACPQPNKYTGATKGVRDVHEDCLYLNIYMPNIDAGVSQLYPVMMYIHGGDFIHGSSNSFPGHIMAGFQNVVVVTFNYRLGALGFLSTGDHNSPGNYGILDMAMAIRWVHENINYFNGDKNLITLFGPDAGAASAGLLMVNPRTRHMVNRVIAMSGSALADWALIQDKYKAQNTSRVFARHLGCSIDSSYKLVDCLRRHRNFYELGNANDISVGMFPWAPVLDLNFTVPGNSWYEGWKQEDWFFTNFTPEAQIRRGEFNRGLAYMTGVTTQEAATLISSNETLSPYFDIDEEWFDRKVEEMVFRYNYTINREGIFRAIKYRYTYWPDPKNHTHIREQYIDLMSDFIYRAPVDQMVKLLVEKQVPVYWYVTNTTIESLKLPLWRKAPHNIEHLLLTGAPFMDTEFFPEKMRLSRTQWTDNDRNISYFFIKAYTDFARYGDPSPQQILGIRFQMARHGRLFYLNFNTTFNSTIEINYRQTESAFWTWYLPTVIGIVIPTYPPFTEYWWEPKQPLQIAFWSMSGTCLLLIVVVVIFCLLWRNAKRQSDRYYGTDLLMIGMQDGESHGIENPRTQSAGNIYEYRDLPVKTKPIERKGASTPASLRSSDGSLSGRDGVLTSPNGRPKTPPGKRTLSKKSVSGSTSSVPMTQV